MKRKMKKKTPNRHTYLDQHFVHVLATGDGVHVLLEVHREELKHQVQFTLLHQNILQPATQAFMSQRCPRDSGTPLVRPPLL